MCVYTYIHTTYILCVLCACVCVCVCVCVRACVLACRVHVNISLRVVQFGLIVHTKVLAVFAARSAPTTCTHTHTRCRSQSQLPKEISKLLCPRVWVVCVFVCICRCLYTQIYSYTRKYIRIQTHTHTHTHTLLRLSRGTCESQPSHSSNTLSTRPLCMHIYIS